jgi:hypothetical protein
MGRCRLKSSVVWWYREVNYEVVGKDLERKIISNLETSSV